MSDISPIGRPNLPSYNGSSRAARAYQNTPRPERGGQDQVDFSSEAQLLSRLKNMSTVRHDLVDRVKAEIQAGTYETPEKLESAVEAMLDDLA
ncbi:MAG: flagellar biosynthesis anti-sigma factor FlgM [Phycisphaeraceae bacterium]